MVVHSEDLRVRIGRHEIVRHINLHCEVGVWGLLGRNGAGKTTLMRTLATALRPTSGELTILGTNVTRSSTDQLRNLRREIGYASQTPFSAPHLTVSEQVEYAAWLKGLTRDASRARTTVVLEQVGLSERAHDKTRTLSGGMLRRLNIAMAMISQPAVLLLDEPTAGLDPEQRAHFRRLVVELGERSLVVLSTHLIEDVAAICDNAIVLVNGKQVYTGSVGELARMGQAISGQASVEAGFLRLTGHVRS